MRWLLAALLGVQAVSACPAAFAQHTLELLEENGPSENRVDLLIMGDGYTAAQQDAFHDDAEVALARLRDKRPFGPYAPFFNVARISSISAQSGADHPGEGQSVDTPFGCAYDCMGLDRLICCDDAAIFTVADTIHPAHDVILLLVNDPEYGGSGGAVAITSNNIQAMDVPPHEFGHTFAMLGDEYDDPYPGYTCEDIFPNVAFTADPDELKWSCWVDDGTPLPTPEAAATGDLSPVGAYEGACYESEGLFRPVPECLMRALGSDMCSVCAQALVLALYGYVEPIDGFSPAAASVEGELGETLVFAVEPVRPAPDTVEVAWLLDGAALAQADGDTFELDVECIELGEHSLEAVVQDSTDLVRLDPEALMRARVEWVVDRTDDGPTEDCWDEDTDTGADTDADADGDSDADQDTDGDANDGTGESGCDCAVAAGPNTGVLLFALFL